MPKGVEAVVEDGFATIDFVDPALRGPGLQKLIEIGGPEMIETITREGPRRRYRVPEGNAREAGLIDSPVQALERGDTGFAAALADASPAGARPDPQAVSRAYGSGQGTYHGALRPGVNDGSQQVTSDADVLGTQSVQTTVDGGAGFGGGVAPTHAEVIERVKTSQQAPTTEPSKRWNREELDAYAASKGIDTSALETKAEVVDLINRGHAVTTADARSESAQTPPSPPQV